MKRGTHKGMVLVGQKTLLAATCCHQMPSYGDINMDSIKHMTHRPGGTISLMTARDFLSKD